MGLFVWLFVFDYCLLAYCYCCLLCTCLFCIFFWATLILCVDGGLRCVCLLVWSWFDTVDAVVVGFGFCLMVLLCLLWGFYFGCLLFGLICWFAGLIRCILFAIVVVSCD